MERFTFMPPKFYRMKSTPFRLFLAPYAMLAALVFLLSNCTNPHQSELKQIDSLVDIAQNQLYQIEALNLDSMQLILAHSGNGLNILQSAQPDSLIMIVYLNFVSLYGDINKAMKRGMPAIESHKMALQESLMQLNNLEHDIKKGLLNDTLINGYLQAEQSILNQIKSESEVVLTNIRMKQDFFRQNQAKIDSFIQENFQ